MTVTLDPVVTEIIKRHIEQICAEVDAIYDLPTPMACREIAFLSLKELTDQLLQDDARIWAEDSEISDDDENDPPRPMPAPPRRLRLVEN